MSSANKTTHEVYLSTSEGNITPANVIAVGAVLPMLGFIAVAARFYGRKSAGGVFLGADDWLILVSLVRTQSGFQDATHSSLRS
jgi:hypothetical protein